MILYSITSTFINLCLSIALGLFVLARKPNHLKHITYFLFAFSVGITSLFYLLWLFAETSVQALLFARLYVGAAFFIPVFYLHHLYTILKLRHSKEIILRFAYLLAFVCLCLTATPYVVAGVSPKLEFPFWPNPGILGHLFLAVWVGICLYIDWLALNFAKRTKGMIRMQLKFILVGTILGYLGVFSNLFLWYNIMIPPFGNIFMSFFVIVSTYAVLRNRFMNKGYTKCENSWILSDNYSSQNAAKKFRSVLYKEYLICSARKKSPHRF